MYIKGLEYLKNNVTVRAAGPTVTHSMVHVDGGHVGAPAGARERRGSDSWR